MKIRADMYGMVEGKEGSWNWAVAEMDFPDDTRNLASETHFRPSASAPPPESPQLKINESDSHSEPPLSTCPALKTKKKKTRENKTWVLNFIA